MSNTNEQKLENPSRRSILNALAVLPIRGAFTRESNLSVKRLPRQGQCPPKTHIAVIGAGAFGGWTALYLLRQGARVTLLDAWGAGNSRASSGGETRVIRSIYGPDRIYVELVKRAFTLWRENEKRWRTQLYYKTGSLWMFSADDTYAKNSLPLVSQFGFEVETLSLAEAQRRYPQINFDGVRTVYYEREAGYLLARRACRVVLDGFIQEGGHYRQVEVTPGRIESGALQDIRLSDGSSFDADIYVFACGPWLGKLLPGVTGDQIVATRQEVYYFGTPPGDSDFSEERLPTWIDFAERLYYGIPSTDGRGFKVADDTRGAVFDPTTGDRTPSIQGITAARQMLARRFPKMSRAPLVEARVCQYENSTDGHFIVDTHPKASNLWVLGGGSGHGFKFGPALGEYVAERVLGRSREPLDKFFSLGRLVANRAPTTQFSPRKKP